MIDYSQFGQALLLEQLLTPDMPRVLVDIGAHDGITGSNSRALLEKGWGGLLIEPLPEVFVRLAEKCRAFSNATAVCAAVSDRDGVALLTLGKDGPGGQRSSFSNHPAIARHLSGDRLPVRTWTLGRLLQRYDIPPDFGVLLIDTEGWDLNILQASLGTEARPRLIVTEDFQDTNRQKYSLLKERGYRLLGVFRSDSFWMDAAHRTPSALPEFPVLPVAPEWALPEGCTGQGQAALDPGVASFEYVVAGWAWVHDLPPTESELTAAFKEARSAQRYLFGVWRTPRPDVALAFQTDALLMAGFRVHAKVPPGEYFFDLFEQGHGRSIRHRLGRLALPLPSPSD